jgi:Uma2 family endonuclease
MTAVQTTTEVVPELVKFLHLRHEARQDTYDEWWDGVYRTVTGPTPEHGELLNELVVLLHPLVKARGLRFAAPVNIGIDKVDCRVPDLGVYRPDTPRTSPAFLETAELVVEVLSPGERAGEKLPFYAAWNVKEYLEIDLAAVTVRLLANQGGTWAPIGESEVLDFDVLHEAIVAPGAVVTLRDFLPPAPNPT